MRYAVIFTLASTLIISSVLNGDQIYYIDVANGNDTDTGISEAKPWRTLANVNERTFDPGDRILLKRDMIWEEELVVQSDSEGTAANPITFGVYGNGSEPVIRRMTIRGDYIIVQHIAIDHNREGGDALRLRGAKHCVLRHLTVRNGLADGIDAADASGLLIDSCLIHHFLAGSFTDQADAHGIVATDTQGLTVRNTEVHHVSGDSFQTDPNRGTDISDDILIEDCHFWTSPLTEDFNDRWFAGQTPGENAIDTKVAKSGWESAPRMRITVKNIRAHGWINDGFIGNRAAFNMKEKIEAVFDGVTVHNCEIAFRLRGSRGNANVTLMNTVIYDCEKAIRAENSLSDLRIYNSTFGDGIDTNIQITAGNSSDSWDTRNNAFVDSRPAVASASSNKTTTCEDFADSSKRNYYPRYGSGLIDAGTAIPLVTIDRNGEERPQNGKYDVGAYEYRTKSLSENRPRVRGDQSGAQPVSKPGFRIDSKERRVVYGWFPRDVNDWSTSAIDWSALTHICFRSVVLQPDGNIKPGWGCTTERVKELVEEAHRHGVKVTVLAWGTNAENSSKYLANCPEKVADSLLQYVKANGLDGVNMDDETWSETNTGTGKSNRELVTRFFRLLHDKFRAERADYHISYASPPVISARDKFGADWIDYAAIANYIDAFTIMAYCMNPPTIGWTGAAQPVEGGGKVTGHARDYVTLIRDYLDATDGRAEKLVLGISNFRGGAEWTCRTNKSLSPIIGKPRRLSPDEARANERKYGRKFHHLQKSPWYCYKDGQHWVQGWYEDDESFAAKLKLVREHSLRGICVWVLDGAKEPQDSFKLIHSYLHNTTPLG